MHFRQDVLNFSPLLIVLFLVLGSCAEEEPPPETFCIYGYTCGDSIDDRISIEYTYEGHEQIQICEYQDDARASKEWLWRDPIWNDKIILSKMQRNNPDSLYSLYFEKPVTSNWVTR